MDSIALHVYLLTEDQPLGELLQKCPPVDGAALEFQTVAAAQDLPDLTAPDAPEDILLVSDDLTRLQPFFETNRSDLHLIWIASELTKAGVSLPAHLLDIWPAAEPDGIRLHRFHEDVARIVDKFNAWRCETWLMTLIDSMQDLVWYKDKPGLHWLVNHRFEETVHKTRAQVHGMGHNYIWDVPPEDGGKSEFRCLESEREVMEKKRTCVADEHVKTDYGMRHFLTYKTPIFGRGGDVIGTVGIGHDVTDLNNRSLEMTMLLENLPFPIAVVDADWKPVQLNSKFEKEFAVAGDHLEAFDYNAWKERTFLAAGERTYSEAGHAYSQELTLAAGGGAEEGTEDGERIFVLTEQEILDYFGNISGYYCLYRDITVERAYEEMILTFANTDALTKLYNRRYFFEHLGEKVDAPMTVLFMDMDNFKRVNDTFGHASGDLVLTSTAQIIENNFPDGLIARLGGDEFAVCILGDISDADLSARTTKLREEIEKAFGDMNLGLSISVGVARAPGRVTDVDAFLNESDQRMYENKQARRKTRG